MNLRALARCGSVALAGALAGASGWAAPPAPSVPVTDTHFGVAVPDPFRNLEDLRDARTQDWLRAQGEHAAAQLARIEGRDALRERIAQLADGAGAQVHDIARRPGGRVFFLRRDAGRSQYRLVVREGPDGAERVLVDPQALADAAGGVPHAINYYQPSNDGRRLAYGVSAGGSEDASLHLIDVASGRALREPVPRVTWSALHWGPGDRWLSFTQLRALPPGAPDSETYLDASVRVIDLQRPRQAPRAVFGPLVDRRLGLERLDFGALLLAPDSRFMVARTTDTTVPEGKLFVAPVSALARGGRIAWRQFASADDKITDVQLRGDTLFLRSYRAAPRGQVLALPLADARMSRARVVVPEPERAVLQAFSVGRRAVYTEERMGFNTRVLRHDPSQPGAGRDVAPSLAGSTFAIVDRHAAERDELWLATSAWTEPSRVLAAAPDGTLADTRLRRNARPAGSPGLVVREVEVPSHDGVRVPLAVVHREGLALDGRNPTLLDGYGAYGETTQAWYDARRDAWFERGGVLAFVNPRGSGAYGDAWHRAGFKASKPNTWKDGIAAARWLVAQGYATPATLAVQGGSAGGIFVGRALTEAPELFAAAIANVGVLDTVRFELSANGATNVSEFGSVRVEPEFKALLEMSTYHQIRDGVAYPAVLLVHGMNDPRVDVWHSAKAAARLQQASASGKPVLLRLDAQAGHGVGSTAQQAQAQRADEWAFLLWQMGLAGQKAQAARVGP